MSNIPTIKIGNTDLLVSQICFGGEQLGGFELGEYDIDQTIHTAQEAIEKGVNFFDTADCYNFGESEKNLSIIIKHNRDKIIVSSKFGVRMNANNKINRVYYDNSCEWIDQALDGSLRRLQTDYIDLYQLHHWDQQTPLEQIFEYLESKCDQGKIRYYGVSNLTGIYQYTDNFPHLISFSNEYSLVHRNQETDIKKGIESKKGFLAFGTLGQGILTGKYNSYSKFGEKDRRSKKKYPNFHGKKLIQNLKIVETLKDISQKYQNRTIAQIALRWILDYLNNTILVTGIKNSKQLNDNLKTFDFQLDTRDVNQLDELSKSLINRI